jgi:hypothetical protein
MAKDNRKIHSGVRHKGTTYTDGMEDELAAAVSGKQLERLIERGAISGNWQSSAAEVEEVETEDELTDDDSEEEVEEETEEAPAKQTAAKKSASKKSAAKKSAK